MSKMAFAFVAKRNVPWAMALLLFKQNNVEWYLEINQMNDFSGENVGKSNY